MGERMCKVIVSGDSVEIHAEGQDLSYVVGMARALWDETRTPERTPLGFSREEGGRMSDLVVDP